MTVGDLTERMSAREFRAWQLLDRVEYEERKKLAPTPALPTEDELEELE